ncbi:MAG: DUF2326 domain-containing protein [Verrucomicrobiaceae bacterium]|nr:DUF2326 domain-containing protein [Verrucomicrobiaceae bacterium]
MIQSIYSSLESFKPVKLKPGFNLLVSDKSQANAIRPSRNHAGKTSVVEIIHFLLGGDVRAPSPFLAQELQGQIFGMNAEIAGRAVKIERGIGAGQNEILLGSTETIEGDLLSDVASHRNLSVKEWCRRLGEDCFGVTTTEPYSPTFRSLFSYFARRSADGGFLKADSSSKHVTSGSWQMQVNLGFLLGLDWRLPAKMEKLRQEDLGFKLLAKTLRSDTSIGQAFGGASQLSASLAIARDRAKKFERELAEFRVLEQYAEVEKEASMLEAKLSDNANQNKLDEELIIELKKSSAQERPPAAKQLERIYESAQIDLPGVVREHLDKVRRFHDAVIVNRQQHLQAEITAAESRIRERGVKSRQWQARLTEAMQLLKTHGALEKYSLVARELEKHRAEVALLEKRLEIAQQIEDGGKALKVQRAEIERQMTLDRREREAVLNDAAVMFHEMSERVCEKASTLHIETDEKGLQIRFSGGPDHRRGIPYLEMLCFDLTLMRLAKERGFHPPLLVHDSALFDPLEERQITNALELGLELSDAHGFQYLVTMNTDRLADATSRNSRVLEHVIEPHLTDELETGGLFGCVLTYPPKEKKERRKRDQ